MGKFILKRFCNMLLVMLGVSVIVFLLLRLSNGDPAYIKLSGVGIPVTDELLYETREAMGLNLPVYQQFWNSFTGMLTGDLGLSYRTGRPVLEELVKGLGPTLKLAGASFLLTVALSVPLGIVTALYANRAIDYIIRVTSFLATAMPLFALGLLLIYVFSLELQWLPVSGSESIAGLVLPTLSLSLGLVGRYTKQIRGNVVYNMTEDTAKFIASTMMMGMPVENFDEMAQSAISELSNMLTANTATHIAGLGLEVDISTPSLSIGEDFQIKISSDGYLAVDMDLGGHIVELDISVATT